MRMCCAVTTAPRFKLRLLGATASKCSCCIAQQLHMSAKAPVSLKVCMPTTGKGT